MIFLRRFLSLAVAGTLALSSVTSFAQDRGRWVNPGGMWMPQQIQQHAELLRQLGFQFDPSEMSDPSSKTMQAIISLAYCSGSFISPTGLIITNHHCVQKMLTYINNQDRAQGVDWEIAGVNAKTRSAERNGGPTERVYVTQAVIDVTNLILDGIGNVKDPVERSLLIEQRAKDLQKESERERVGIRSEVKSFYQGAKFYLIERLEIKDVRLVFVPPKDLGFFGGDDDNWQWPRHTADFAVIRAYVGPDGNPAPYSPNNIPYVPKNFLKVSAQGVNPNSPVIVAGYPGTTSRLNTSDSWAFQRDRSIKLQVHVFQKLVEKIDALRGRSDEMRKALGDTRASIMNALQNRVPARNLLANLGLVEQRAEFEAELKNWVDADLSRKARYGNFLEEMREIRAKARSEFEGDFFLGRLMAHSMPIAAAETIVHMAQERVKPDDKREPGFQERDWERLRQAQARAQNTYLREVDLELSTLMLELALELPADKQPSWLGDVVDRQKLAQGVTVRQQLEALYSTTEMENLEKRLELLNNASHEQLQASTDPVVKLALKLREVTAAQRQRDLALSGELALVIPRYMAAMHEFVGRPIAPDANSTLRVTFGRVRGYRDAETGRFYQPQTHISGLVDKTIRNSSAREWYNTPREVLAAIRERRFGLYADPAFGEVPVNFTADVDTTGGNSGSAALNAKGELIGLLFDGTTQSLNVEWAFLPNNRSILLDIRFALWLMDEVYDRKDLLSEMTIDMPDCDERLVGDGDSARDGKPRP